MYILTTKDKFDNVEVGDEFGAEGIVFDIVEKVRTPEVKTDFPTKVHRSGSSRWLHIMPEDNIEIIWSYQSQTWKALASGFTILESADLDFIFSSAPGFNEFIGLISVEYQYKLVVS